MIKGAYVHIPFCEHICYYCDFNKYFIKNQPVEDYLKALDLEMATTMIQAGGVRPETIFIGGGTPTVLQDEHFARLLESIRKHLYHEETAEFAVEINPENLNIAKLEAMKRAGVDRLSIGIQTFDDTLLAAIGRMHSRESAIAAVQLAKDYGFHNISVDLMFGLPGQTRAQLEHSLHAAMQLDPQHISIYSLQVEPRTIFYHRMKQGKLKLPGQDIEAEMYELLIKVLRDRGFEQYEISNFAKPGYESRHNIIYWNNEEYYGFGAGAHGYIQGQRVVNARAVKGYITRVRSEGHAMVERHSVTLQEKVEEELFLGLRKLRGINKKTFEEKYHRSLDYFYKDVIANLVKKGLLHEDKEHISLTEKGVFLGNEVFEAFLV
ncbi:oxygen-independent coproporphyrinogen-3 oxidase [Pullulanibacillus pueri]|uniref:Heme chaperone HemW n=1 Tax=Pullulanibacillus pueri TaxID=1437324 RepID=A0A8J2ZY97_9BACL|nr:radical SAM family heme chaperone HemW [Pullulanibacillus pueri]MBM7683062.1 oxygen-independent coproporphyrinogen-3 oxidase [Pullulanibacillus pueri]GGH84922.1 oxygen-independent coproporphyrinogen-III oxidase-like protein YqeR [Pullulanibacillus pueri]